VTAQHLVRRPAVQALRTGVPHRDEPLGVEGDDGVLGVVEQSGQVGQPLLLALLLGHVGLRHDGRDDPALPVAYR
jgi:hypothetical protein